MLSRARAWLKSWPLQRRVAWLTTVAVALAVAATSVAGYVTLRYSLYSALDDELIDIASSLAVPVAQDIRNLGGLTERALRAGNISVAAVRADKTVFYVPDEREHLVIGHDEYAVARLHRSATARSGVASDGEEYRIVAVPITGSGQLRPGARTSAAGDQQHLELAVAGADHLRRGRRDHLGRRRGHGGPLQPATRTPAVGRRRTGHRHQGAGADRDQRQRRHRQAGRVVQPDAALAGLVAGAAAAADRRRRARAAYAADQPAHQHRAAGRGRQDPRC